MLAVDVQLLSPGVDINNQANNSIVASISRDGSKVAFSTRANQVNGETLPGGLHTNDGFLRDATAGNVASSYQVVSTLIDSAQTIVSPNGLYAAEWSNSFQSGFNYWTLPPGVTYRYGAQYDSYGNEIFGTPRGYYGSDGSYYKTDADLPRGGGFSEYRLGKLQIRNLTTGTVDGLINLDTLGITRLNSISDTGIVTGEAFNIAYQLANGNPTSVFYYNLIVTSPLIHSFTFETTYGLNAVDGTLATISADGNYLAYVNSAGYLVLLDRGGSGNTQHVYAQITDFVRQPGDSFSYLGFTRTNLSLSADGRYLVYSTAANGIVAGDNDNNLDVFRFDRLDQVSNPNQLVSVSEASGISDGQSMDATISDDGRFVAFVASPNTMLDERYSSTLDVYVKDLQTGKLIIAPSAPFNFSLTPKISGNGRYVAYDNGSFSGGGSYFNTYRFFNAHLVNLPPVVSIPLVNKSILEGVPLVLQLPAGTFTDPNLLGGDSLTYLATQLDGSALPSWIHFDPTTLRLTGTPGNNDVGSFYVKIKVTDQGNLSASSSFLFTVDDVNEAPTLGTPLEDQTVRVRDTLNYYFPATTFRDNDVRNGDRLTLVAKLATNSSTYSVLNSPLPSWLYFYAAPEIGAGVFYGTPPNGFYPETTELLIVVSALDNANLEVSDVFKLTVIVPPARPAPAVVYVDPSWYARSITPNSIGEGNLASFGPLTVTTAAIGPPIESSDPDGDGPATELYYDAFRDIQEAIDSVAIGGTVVIHDGNYYEGDTGQITNRGKQVVISPGGGILGETPALVRTYSNLMFDSAATLRMDLVPPAQSKFPEPGIDYDQFEASFGTIQLSNPALELVGTFGWIYNTYELFYATGYWYPDPPITGSFAGIPSNYPNGSNSIVQTGAGLAEFDFSSGNYISVKSVNRAPTAIALTPPSSSLPENTNTSSAIVLAAIQVTDDGIGTNVLSLGGPDSSSFEIVNDNQLRLKAGVVLDFETQSSYSVRVNVDDATVGGTSDAFQDFTLSITDVFDAPVLTNVVVNGGDTFRVDPKLNYPLGGGQRSQVTSLTVTFSVPVTLSPGAFDIVNNGLETAQTPVAIAQSQILVSGSGTTFTIRFGSGFGSGSGVNTRDTSTGIGRGNSLADGNYLLTINPTKVKDVAAIQSLTSTNSFKNGDNRFGDQATDYFFRLFGDADGNAVVNSLDTGAFARALTATVYNAAVDFDGNGEVVNSGVDRMNFLGNFNKRRRAF